MKPAWLPLAAPMIVFLVCTTLEGRFGPALYPALYAVKAGLTALALLLTAPGWRPLLRWESRPALLGALAGVAGLALWLVLDKIAPPLTLLGKREAFDPSGLGVWKVPFLSVRFFGLVVLVPLVEELFWRGFLLRYVSDMERWEEKSIEAFTPLAMPIVSALFALAHPEWLAALVYGLGLCALLKATKSLLACIAAHAVTNLLLGVYILVTHAWQLW